MPSSQREAPLHQQLVNLSRFNEEPNPRLIPSRISYLHLPKLLLIAINLPDLLRTPTALIKPQVHPFLHQLLRQLRPHHSLTETQHLRVVAQHRSLHRVGVVRCDGADASDFVRGDGDAETGAADEEGAVGLFNCQ